MIVGVGGMACADMGLLVPKAHEVPVNDRKRPANTPPAMNAWGDGGHLFKFKWTPFLPHQADRHATTSLIPQILQSLSRLGMLATWCVHRKRCAGPRHQRQSGAQMVAVT